MLWKIMTSSCPGSISETSLPSNKICGKLEAKDIVMPNSNVTDVKGLAEQSSPIDYTHSLTHLSFFPIHVNHDQ